MRQLAKTSEKQIRRTDTILWIISLLTILPFVGVGIIYSKTFINIWYLVVFGLVSGLILGLTTYKKIKDYSNQELKNHITFCVFVFGVLLNYGLLWINYNFPRHEIKTYDSRIIEYAMSNRRGSSVLTIEFAGIIKDIRMPIEDYKLLKEKGYVTITVDKGLLGIYIIVDKKIL
jgi:heme/copper-type cytochrome/quinol oxidase subunit 4